MADVRSLLRTELATRRITHPFASYSATGTLSCNLCKQSIKSHSLWETHLRSSSHLARVSQHQQQTRSALSGPENGSKKRRLDDEGGVEDDISAENREKRQRKSVDGRPTEEGLVTEESLVEDDDSQRDDEEEDRDEEYGPAETGEAKLSPAKEVDEDEWAAFEQDIAQVAAVDPLVEVKNPRNVLDATAVISAPALSASELQRLQKGDAGGQKDGESALDEKRRRAREEEESEREEARRRLEEEWDVMHSYEERVRRLKMRREELRHQRHGNGDTADGEADGAGAGGAVRRDDDDGGGDRAGEDEDDTNDGLRPGGVKKRASGSDRQQKTTTSNENDDGRGEEASESEESDEEEWNSRWDPF